MLSNEVFDKVYTLAKSGMATLEVTDDDGNTFPKWENLSYSRSSKVNEEPKLPCVYIRQIGAIQIGDDLERISQNAVNSTFQVESYSNISYDEAYEIMNDVGDIFNKLGYSLTFGIEELSTETIWRFVARFNRKIGANDVLTLTL